MATVVQGLVARMGFDNTAYKKGMQEVKSTAERTRSSIGKIGQAMAGVFAGYGAFRAMKGAISSAAQFQTGMAEVSTLLDTSKVSMAGLTKEVLGLAKSVGVSPKGLTKAYYQAISAGVDAAQATDLVRVAAKAGIAGLSDTYTAVDVLTSVVNAYGDSAQNASKYSDILFETVRMGKTTFPELARTVGRVAPIAAQMKIPFEEVAAAIGTMTLKGVDTDTAVTGLRQTLVSILNPTKEAADTAAALGLQFNATAVASKGLGQFMDEVMRATRGNAEVLTKLFGNVRALTGVLAAFTGDTFKKQLEEMQAAAGATDRAFGKMNETVGRKWEAAKAKFEVAAIDLATKVLPKLAGGLEHFSEAIDYLSGAPIRPEAATGAYARAQERYREGLLRYSMPHIKGLETEKFLLKGEDPRLAIPFWAEGWKKRRIETAKERLEAAIPFNVIEEYRRTAGFAEWAEMRARAGTREEMGGRAGAAGRRREAGREAWRKGMTEALTPPPVMQMLPPEEWVPRLFAPAQKTEEYTLRLTKDLPDAMEAVADNLSVLSERVQRIESDLKAQHGR
jgi:TP901 family phage tail tape measure protein